MSVAGTDPGDSTMTDDTTAQFETFQSDNQFGDVTNVVAYISEHDTFALTEVWVPEVDDRVTIDHAL